MSYLVYKVIGEYVPTDERYPLPGLVNLFLSHSNNTEEYVRTVIETQPVMGELDTLSLWHAWLGGEASMNSIQALLANLSARGLAAWVPRTNRWAVAPRHVVSSLLGEEFVKSIAQ